MHGESFDTSIRKTSLPRSHDRRATGEDCKPVCRPRQRSKAHQATAPLDVFRFVPVHTLSSPKAHPGTFRSLALSPASYPHPITPQAARQPNSDSTQDLNYLTTHPHAQPAIPGLSGLANQALPSMTQGGPPPPPEHNFMSGGLPPMDYENISPMQQGFTDPFPPAARRSRQMDRDDLPQRVSSMDLGGDMYLKREPSRKRSVSRPSILRRSTTTSIPEPIDYELWRFEKSGDEWTHAIQKQLPASQKDLAKKVKSKSKNGPAVDQIQKMAQNRLGQVDELVEKKSRQTGVNWEAAWIEDVKSSISRKNKKDVRIFDVIVARAGLNSTRASLSKARTESLSSRRGELVVLKGRNNSFKDNYDGDKKDKDKDSGFGKQGGGKNKEVVDPDPFGNSKLFAPSGKPLEPDGGVPFDEVRLPPNIKEDEPIGRRVSKKRGGSRGGKSHHGGDDADEIVELHGDDGAFGEDGAAEVLDGMMDFDNILPKSKNKKKKNSRSRSRSKATTRNYSRSKSRSRAHNEHRSKGSERVDRYMDDRSSVSSNGSGRSNFFEGEDDITSTTSSSIHHGMEERGSLHRRGSSKHEKLPFREHYRGPQRGGYVGEQIMIPERPIRRLSTSYARPQKLLGYGDPYISGQRSPDFGRSPSPRRAYGGPGLLYPHELREADERSEHYIDSYMSKDRLVDYRERELDERERAVARKERALKRVSGGYGYVSDGRYK